MLAREGNNDQPYEEPRQDHLLIPSHHLVHLRQLVQEEAHRSGCTHEQAALQAIFRMGLPQLTQATIAELAHHGIHIPRVARTPEDQRAFLTQQNLVLQAVLGEDWAQEFPLNYQS